jgi:hypothetical protein
MTFFVAVQRCVKSMFLVVRVTKSVECGYVDQSFSRFLERSFVHGHAGETCFVKKDGFFDLADVLPRSFIGKSLSVHVLEALFSGPVHFRFAGILFELSFVVCGELASSSMFISVRSIVRMKM